MAVRVLELPGQSAVGRPTIATVAAAIFTVAVLCIEQPLVPVMITEYVVVTLGETAMDWEVLPFDQLKVVPGPPPGPPVKKFKVTGALPGQVETCWGLTCPFGEGRTVNVWATGLLAPDAFEATRVTV
jgi:hypothetical protein